MDTLRNVGPIDRILRLAIGIALVVYAYYYLIGTPAWVVGAIGAVLALTGAFGTCMLYRLLGVSTAER